MPDEVPPRVFACAELEIDRVLSPLCRDGDAPRVRPELRRYAIGYGRRALEIAIVAAVTEREQAPPRDKWEPRWKLIRDRAGRAATAVELALCALVPDKERPKGYGRPGHLVQRLRRTRYGTKQKVDLRQMGKRASRDVAAILLARATLARLRRDTERRRSNFTNAITNRDTPDAIEKRAFIQKLAETWVFLMGRRPGKAPTVDRNPFLRFAEAAWRDWKGENITIERMPSFVAPLRDALAVLSDRRVAALVAVGPEWMGDPYAQFIER